MDKEQLEKAWKAVSEGEIKPDVFIADGEKYVWVKPCYEKGRWIPAHYEQVEE